jgi:hypothetical protein
VPLEGTTASRSTWLNRSPYLVVAVVLVALMTVQTLNRAWSTDYWFHQAVLETLSRDLVDPPHALVGNDAPCEYFSPYSVTQALVMRATGLSSVVVLQLFAIVNLLLLLVTFRLFVTKLVGRRDVAAYALIASLVFWGLSPWRWSGLLNLNSIGFGLPYPSTFATALALFAGWAVLRYDESLQVRWLPVIGICMATVALSHPFTGVWTAAMLTALAWHRRLYRRATIVGLAITAVATAIAVLVWPYYSIVDLASAGSFFSRFHRALYASVPLRLLAILPGLFVIARRARRDRTDPLALMFVFGVGLYALGPLLDDANYGRTLPLVVLPLHIGLGVLIADLLARRGRANRWLTAWVVVSGVIGLVGVVPGVARMVPSAIVPDDVQESYDLGPITEPYAALDGALPFGTIVVTDSTALVAVGPAYGLPVVDHPTAFVDDLADRQRVARVILNPRTRPAVRAALAKRYDVGAVLCRKRSCRRLFRDGEVLSTDDFFLARLPSD